MPKALYEAYALNVAVPAEVKAARGVVLFVVQVGERNIADQKALDLALWQQGCLQSLWPGPATRGRPDQKLEVPSPEGHSHPIGVWGG